MTCVLMCNVGNNFSNGGSIQDCKQDNEEQFFVMLAHSPLGDGLTFWQIYL